MWVDLIASPMQTTYLTNTASLELLDMLSIQKGSRYRTKKNNQELCIILRLHDFWTFLDSETEPISHILTLLLTNSYSLN